MMLLRFTILILSSVIFLHGSNASSCDKNCEDKPVFKPSSLIVKYGDPTSARCSVCQHACHGRRSGLEIPTGMTRQDGTLIFWDVYDVTEWDMSAMCYYTDDNDNQCCSELPITVYQPPRFMFMDFSGYIKQDHTTLQCTVYEVAPVASLVVTFYKGQMVLGQLQSNNTEKEPVIETFSLTINENFEDDVEYWCEAKLDLGPEGPQPPPVMRSENNIKAIRASGTMIQSFSMFFMLLLVVLVSVHSQRN